MADNSKYDVFLSHNHADKPKVRRLAERLKAAGVKVWLDDWVVKPGDIIALKVDEGLEESRVLLLCISKAALSSGWVALERSTAVHRDPANEGRRFVPLLLENCELPDTLRRYKYIDFREETNTTFEEVVRICKSEEIDVSNELGKKKKYAKKGIPRKQLLESERVVREKSLVGHKGWITSVVVSPNGKWFVSASHDNNIKIWNLETGKCLNTLKGHTSKVMSVAITPDGERIVSAAFDDSIRIWEMDSGQELIKLTGHTKPIWSVVVFHDNTQILSAGYDNTLRLWDLTLGECVRTISLDKNADNNIFGIAINKLGTTAMTGHRNGCIRLWDIESGECFATLKGHLSIVYSVHITSDGQLGISGSSDKTIKVWNLKTNSCIGTLEGHYHDIDSIAICAYNDLIASTGCEDNSVRLWNRVTGTCLYIIEYSYFRPTSVAFSTDGLKLVVGSAEGTIHIYRVNNTSHNQLINTDCRYVNAKVVLLGEKTVGKTSLAHRLIDDEYVIKDRTHGMNVWRLNLPLPPDKTFEREALLWDLAGQEYYRLIHQLFLSETALALLIINPQEEDPFAEASEWLKALNTAANNTESKRKSDKLLIFSQTDVGGMKLSDTKIKRFCKQYGFAGWLSTSAKNGENCSDKINNGKPSKLKQLIAESIPWDKLPWTSTPRLLAELKNAVISMSDDSDIRLLRFSELAQRLEQALPNEKFSEQDMRTAVALLANHGLVHSLKFGDLVLLHPHLMNGYASAVIRAARKHTDEIGSILEENIYHPDFDFTGVERLKHRPDEQLLLRALVQIFLGHSLCIAEDTPKGRHLVFPSQYRREKDIPHKPDIFVSYTFNGEWQTVWTTLVVRLWYSHEFEHKELWRNAAEFQTVRKQTLGLMIKKMEDGTAMISLYFDLGVPDELRVIFIEYVHRHLEKYACDVVRERRYVCSKCGTPVTDLGAVQKRKELGKDFIICQICDEQVPFIDFIEQRLKSDPVAQRILAMEATATRELDTQALEQILIGHMMAIAGEANQIFRPTTMFDHGIDGEVEFKDNDGKASGKRIYIQLKSGNSYLRTRKSDGREVFNVKNESHLKYWVDQPVDVYLVIRQKDEMRNEEVIRWMNVTAYLKNRKDKQSRQIIFKGEKLDMEAVYKVRDKFFPPSQKKA